MLLKTKLAERKRGERQQVEVCFATLKRTFGLVRHLRLRWWGWQPGSRRRSPPTPTDATSIVWRIGHRGALRSCGLEILATDI